MMVKPHSFVFPINITEHILCARKCDKMFIFLGPLAYKFPFRYGQFLAFRNNMLKASLKRYMKVQSPVPMLKE